MTQSDACPCGLDAGRRHVNTRTPGDDRPDRAYCRHCRRPIQREPGDTAWTTARIAVPGRDHQCPKAPNPADGPLPVHEPLVVVHLPAR